jgi:hypothetical protein
LVAYPFFLSSLLAVACLEERKDIYCFPVEVENALCSPDLKLLLMC